MNQYLIRFNKTKGQPGRGSADHVWRVFENGREHLAKAVQLNVHSWSEADGEDWNIACKGFMQFINDVAVITPAKSEVLTPKRTCGPCTKCCQGRLFGQVLGHEFTPGKPCFFVTEKGCSIYEDRPEKPCKSFKCSWLADDFLPMWMRPDLSNVIVTERQFDDGMWVQVLEAGAKMDSAVLTWLISWAANNGKNLRYQVDGGWNWIRNSER